MNRLLLFGFLAAVAAAAEDGAPKLNVPASCGKLPKVVNESSGLVKGRRHADKDVFWTHNDSGNSARLFAVDATGNLLRTVTVPHAENIDWEEITIDGKGRLIVCDCGDNKRNNRDGRRKGVILYRLPEPDAFSPDETISPPAIFHFEYPQGEGPYDAEGVFAHGDTAYLFTKQADGTICFKLPLPEKAPEAAVTMKPIARTTTFNIVTGAALSADACHLALINYVSVAVIDLPVPFDALIPNAAGELPLFDAPRRSAITLLGQTEAVAWDKDDLVLTTEGGGIFRCHAKPGK